jgi:GlpG protein
MYSTPKKRIGISFNAPVILGFAAVCVIAQILNVITGGASNRAVFSVYGASLLDPLTWVRCIGHVFGHAGWDHLIGNLMYILILGPMIEEKYGSLNTLFVILATALVTGLVYVLFFPNTLILGASGIVYMMIILASMTNFHKGRIPLTLIAVMAIFLGQEVYDGHFAADNISHLTHILGGICGCALGAVSRSGGKR